MRETLPYDDHLAPDGRVMEILSEHTCQGWLEGYLLTGRHGFFSCYEAFIHIVDSMFNQHAKWLKTTQRDSLAPADRVAQLSADLACLAPGPQRLQPSGSRASSTMSATRRPRSSGSICRRTPIRCSSSPTIACAAGTASTSSSPASSRRRNGSSMDEAIKHCTAGIGIWEWASNDRGGEPDVVMACAGDVPTLETLAAVDLLRQHLPDLQDPRRQRRRPDDAAAARGASARPDRPRFRRAVHHRQAGHLRLSRLSLADPPADLPAHQSRQFPCPRLQGGGHDDDAVRHGRAQRPRPLPSGGRRHRPACRSSAIWRPMPSRRSATS